MPVTCGDQRAVFVLVDASRVGEPAAAPNSVVSTTGDVVSTGVASISNPLSAASDAAPVVLVGAVAETAADVSSQSSTDVPAAKTADGQS